MKNTEEFNQNVISKEAALHTMHEGPDEFGLCSIDGEVIDLDAAMILANIECEVLDLSGVKRLSDEVVQYIALCRCDLIFEDLEEIDEITASLVVAKCHSIYLNKLKHINHKVAKILSSFEGEAIEINGIEEVGDDAAQFLSKFSGQMKLNGLRTLSDNSAEHFANYEGYYLEMRNLDTNMLSQKTVDYLMSSRHTIKLWF
jgi:hypothetical protein